VQLNAHVVPLKLDGLDFEGTRWNTLTLEHGGKRTPAIARA
jgi:hypothetical protein